MSQEIKKKYHVTLLFTGSKYFGEVEAGSKEEAQEIALNSDRNHACLCHQCTNEIELDETNAQDAIAEEI